MSESTSGWLTVSQAAKLIGISERAVRRLIDAPENTARTRQETRRTATGTRQATILEPAWVESLAVEHRQNAAPTVADTPANTGITVAAGGEHGANTGSKTPANDGNTLADGGRNAAQDGATLADTALALSSFGTRIARLEGALVQQIATSLDERLSSLPTKDEMSTAIQQAAQQAAVAVAQEAIRPMLVELAERDTQREADAKKRADELQAAIEAQRKEMESMARQMEALATAPAKRRLWARWFGSD